MSEVIVRFNPSQVGYKRCTGIRRGGMRFSFNPSQVGYKLDI